MPHRRRFAHLTPGDQVLTGETDPFSTRVLDPRTETVTGRRWWTITTDAGRYWVTGRQTALQPFPYPRRILAHTGHTGSPSHTGS